MINFFTRPFESPMQRVMIAVMTVQIPVLALLTVASGCASLSSANVGTGNRRASDQVIKADPRTGDPLTSLEQELTKVHSDRVIVSTALLKSLVKNERLQQTQCKNISGQLEAIKNIDLEEATAVEIKREASP
jgi:hypothetical protein